MRTTRSARSLTVLLPPLLLSAAAAAAPSHDASPAYPEARSFVADTLRYVDELGRYVVLVDRDGDSTVDHAVVYQATQPLEPIAPRREPSARVTYAGDGTVRRVEVEREAPGSARRALVRLEIDGTPGTEERQLGGDARLRNGVALAVITGYALWPDALDADPEALLARGRPGFDEARTEHLRVVAERSSDVGPSAVEACSCKECTAGGQGSSSCSVKCSGRLWVVEVGENCDVSCGSGYYSCCNCTGYFGAFGTCECRAY